MKAIVFSILRRVGNQPHLAIRWTIRTWPVIALRDPASSGEALREGADAHLIVIPGGYDRLFRLHFRNWLEEWGPLRRIEDAAIGIIGDAINSGATNGANVELRLLIQKLGLSLITDEGPVESAAKLFVNFALEHEHRLPIARAHPTEITVPNLCRAFGIND